MRERERRREGRGGPAYCCCIFFEWPLLLRASHSKSSAAQRRLRSRVTASECSLRICIDNNNNNEMKAGRRGQGEGGLRAIWLTGGHALLTAQQGAKHQVPPNCPTKQQQPQAARQGRSTQERVGVQWGVLSARVERAARSQVGVAINPQCVFEKISAICMSAVADQKKLIYCKYILDQR